MARSQGAPFGRAWFWLCLALLLHVSDEALTGFLGVYNPIVIAVRQRVPWLPLPTFDFYVWLGGLLVAVAVLLSLTRSASRGAAWLRPPAYVFAGLMIANALGHTAGAIGARWLLPPLHLMPGLLSSPLLLAASIYLICQLRSRPAKPALAPEVR
ncbi:MAG TPA: hypothetical protein VGF16_08155 [Bryobacteraceae bacterium]|jgi:hypothetical protein